MSILASIKQQGFIGRHGHPCLYDVIDRAARLCKPRSYLEIGVFDGASLFTVLKATPQIQRLDLCDIFNRVGKYEAGNPQHIRDMLTTLDYSGSVHFHIEDSLTAIPKLAGHKYDLIHIDGNHETEYARQDWINCSKLLAPNGILVMDDTTFSTVKPVVEEMLASGWKLLFSETDAESGSSAFSRS